MAGGAYNAMNTQGNQPGSTSNPFAVNADATEAIPIAAAAPAALVPGTSGSGILSSILVTATGTAQLIFTDGSGGTIIAIVPANAAVGTVITPRMPWKSGLWCAGGASTPAVTVGVRN